MNRVPVTKVPSDLHIRTRNRARTGDSACHEAESTPKPETGFSDVTLPRLGGQELRGFLPCIKQSPTA